MRHSTKKAPFETADFLGTFQPKIKRTRAEPRTRIKRLLREALTFQDKEILEDIHKNFPI